MGAQLTNREMLARIDERVNQLVGEWAEMKPTITSIPKLWERVNWIRLGLFSLGGLLVFVQVVVGLWR